MVSADAGGWTREPTVGAVAVFEIELSESLSEVISQGYAEIALITNQGALTGRLEDPASYEEEGVKDLGS